jgi:hypothetical protein
VLRSARPRPSWWPRASSPVRTKEEEEEEEKEEKQAEAQLVFLVVA